MARLLVKHAIGGRTFLDSVKQQELSYRLEPCEDGTGWRFEIRVPAGVDADVEELLRLKNELNVFVFHTLEDGRVEKIWYYTGDGNISYDEPGRLLKLVSGPELRYLPSDYLE